MNDRPQLETLGRYRLTRVLGEGGMGTVYEAEDEQLRRVVALKVVRGDRISPEISRRFALESEVLGRLQHPGIAQIFEAGTVESASGPRSYFAMELVRGLPLTDYANRQRLSAEDRLDLFARVCDAVHYAHRQGVVHRDLKPANILVDESGQPKILDFGVAKITNADVRATRQTSVGEMVGTLQYMSPEQVNAVPSEIEESSDVYSLGVILYELISGRLPYDLEQAALHDALRVILVQEPAPLSSINRRLRGDVEIIVQKALEKERHRRYRSAEALGSDIRRFLRDEPIIARPASPFYQLRKFARRNRTLVTSAALGIVLLTLGGAVSTWQAIRATRAERLADARRIEADSARALAERGRQLADSALQAADVERANALREQQAAIASANVATAEASKSQAVTSFLTDMLASADPATTQGRDLRVRDLLDNAERRTSATFAAQPEVRAPIEATIGRTYFQLGEYDLARTHLDTAYRLYERTSGTSTRAIVDLTADIGKVARAAGDIALADKRLTEALRAMRAQRAPNDEALSATVAELAGVRYAQARFPEAERLFREALRITRAKFGETHVRTGERRLELGRFLAYTARPKEGLVELERSTQILTAALGANHPTVITSLIGKADAERNQNMETESEGTLRRALSTARVVFREPHPLLADVVSRIGEIAINRGRLAQADTFITEALSVRVSALGADHPDVQLARAMMGRLRADQGRLDEATELYTAALASRRKVLGATNPAVASSLHDLGLLAQRRGDWAESEARLREAVPIWRASGIESEALFDEGAIAVALRRMGRLDEAAQMLRTNIEQRKALNGPRHWTVGDAAEKLGGVLFGQQKYADVLPLQEFGLAIRREVYGATSLQAAFQLPNVALAHEALGDTARAIPFLKEAVDILTPLRPPSDAFLLGAQWSLAVDLCSTGAASEGTAIARRAEAAIPFDSTRMLPLQLRASVAFCTWRAGNRQESEPILRDIARMVNAIPPALQGRMGDLLRGFARAAGGDDDLVPSPTGARILP
ncbi:MAG: serine/threonine protein kinase [Gemmatimonadaceae bacterium]|nr:serine/threonine protein kinase [Gemmatimonadaceae bacterium]